MARPSRYELLTKFFPEINQGTAGDKEAAIRFNTLAAEAILADQIRIFDIGYQADGPGVLILRIYAGAKESTYVTLDDLAEDLNTAERFGDEDTADFLADVLEKAKEFNVSKGVMLMLLDNSSAQLFIVDRDHPAASVEAMLKEFSV